MESVTNLKIADAPVAFPVNIDKNSQRIPSFDATVNVICVRPVSIKVVIEGDDPDSVAWKVIRGEENISVSSRDPQFRLHNIWFHSEFPVQLKVRLNLQSKKPKKLKIEPPILSNLDSLPPEDGHPSKKRVRFANSIEYEPSLDEVDSLMTHNANYMNQKLVMFDDTKRDSSKTGIIIVGVLLLAVCGYVVYQKRKKNNYRDL